jgi:hypothetical protein
VAVDRIGHSCIGGYRAGTLHVGRYALREQPSAFAAAIDPTGQVEWVSVLGAVPKGIPGVVVRATAAADSPGGCHLAGSFTRARFGTTTLVSRGGHDAFVLRMDRRARVLWLVSAGGAGNPRHPQGLDSAWDAAAGVAVDSRGQTYVVGHFDESAHFGSHRLAAIRGWDVFAAKLDTGGKVVWVATAGGLGRDTGRFIGVDGAGNSYIAGEFEREARFGSAKLVASNNGSGVFVAKIDAGGRFLWAKALGAVRSFPEGIAVDTTGNVYVAGQFAEDLTCGQIRLRVSGPPIGFVARLNSAGRCEWVTPLGSDGGGSGTGGVALHPSGIVVVGGFGGTARFGKKMLVSRGDADIFVAKLDPRGRVHWATSAGGPAEDYAHSVSVDGGGAIYVGGAVGRTAHFGSAVLSASHETGFLWRLSASQTE